MAESRVSCTTSVPSASATKISSSPLGAMPSASPRNAIREPSGEKVG